MAKILRFFIAIFLSRKAKKKMISTLHSLYTFNYLLSFKEEHAPVAKKKQKNLIAANHKHVPLHRDTITPVARCIWNKQYLFITLFIIFFLDALNIGTKKHSCQERKRRYTLAQKRLITRSQESNRNNNKCRINQKYYSDFIQILFHKRIPPLCPIRFLLSLWYNWFYYRIINRFITNRSC